MTEFSTRIISGIMLNVSVYFEDIVKSKENYSDEQKAEDKEHMADLFRRAGANADTEVTFRKVLESGEKIRL